MDVIKESIIECLMKFSGEDEKIGPELNKIIKKQGKKTYTEIIYVLTHLYLEPDKAKECWQKIIDHQVTLSKSLKRAVKLQTAICDYFCAVEISLKTPKIVEISVFETKDKASRYDNLTGLLNRSQLQASIDQEWARSSRHNYEFSVLFFDIDNFKKVNDTYGHPVGDLILKNVSRVIIGEIRAEDIAIRYGGEELLIILPQTSKIEAFVLGERIREKIKEKQNGFENKSVNVTVSGGLASFPEDGENTSELIDHADQALYKAKSNGKNNIAIFSKNKRLFIRFDFVTEIQVQNPKDPSISNTIPANTKNISQTGILFESDIPFEIGDVIEIIIRLKTNADLVQIEGTVVRMEIFEPNRYDVGISFIKTHQIAESEISTIVDRLF